MPDEYKGWRCLHRADYDGERLVKYRIVFYRKGGPGDWYDEIRYDSHEVRHGRRVFAPHLHIKIASAPKEDVEAAIAELERIVDNSLEGIEQIAQGSYRPPGEPGIGR